MVNVHDSDRRNHLNGSSSDGENYSLSDYSTGSSIDLRIKGNHFSGFDGQSASKFEGSVGGKLITFFDEQDKAYHNYRLD